jgi:hypothetical protein
MKNCILIVGFVIITISQAFCQKLGHNFGRQLQVIETVSAGDWYKFDRFCYQPYRSIYFEYPIVSNKLNIHIDHSWYKGWTKFSLNELAEVERGFRGHGSSRIKLFRYGLGLNYETVNVGNILKVVPFFKIEYERSSNNSDKVLQVVNSPDPTDSSIFSSWLVSVETFPGNQWIPHVGVRFDLKIIWRIYAHLEYGWSFGNRPYQRLYFDNAIDGMPQQRGEWLSKGTLRIRTLGFSFKFLGPPEKFEKIIDIF